METRRINIQVGEIVLTARLTETETADQIWEALPFEVDGTRWGDEIYFEIPVELTAASDARQEMVVGELAYWPQGHAFCIFFGPTPVSFGDEPRAYSDVNPFGQIEEGSERLTSAEDGATVKVTRLNE
ncbi:MAG: cyclophilin-like fold protein [Anaerolineales bacterium]|jgi:hypothetical protein|nr:cyclophilin-like fold protein [Anaerolineales bacterium]